MKTSTGSCRKLRSFTKLKIDDIHTITPTEANSRQMSFKDRCSPNVVSFQAWNMSTFQSWYWLLCLPDK